MTPTLSDLLGVPTEVEVDGEVFRLRPPALDEQLQFSAWLRARAIRAASALDPQTPDEAADRITRQVMRDIGGGYYEPDAPGYVEAMTRPDGMAHLLYLILRTDHPGVTPEKVRRLVEQGLQRAYLQVLQLEGADPKVLRAVCAALGFPENWLTSSESSSSESETLHSTGSPGKSAD